MVQNWIRRGQLVSRYPDIMNTHGNIFVRDLDGNEEHNEGRLNAIREKWALYGFPFMAGPVHAARPKCVKRLSFSRAVSDWLSQASGILLMRMHIYASVFSHFSLVRTLFARAGGDSVALTVLAVDADEIPSLAVLAVGVRAKCEVPCRMSARTQAG